MDIERASRFHALLEQLLELAPAEHAAFLERECGSDAKMRRELEQAMDAEGVDLDLFFAAPSQRADNDVLPATSSHGQATPDQTLEPSSGAITGPTTGALTRSLMDRVQLAGAMPLFLTLLVAMPILTAFAAAGTARLLSAPDPHFTFGSWSGVVIFVDTELWPELQPGDEMLAVNGQRVDGVKALKEGLLCLDPGEAAVTVRRFRAGELEIEGRVEAFSTVERAVGWSRLAIGVVLLLIGMTAFLLRPEHRSARLLLALCASLAAYLLIYLALLPFPREGLLFEKLFLYLTVGCSLHLIAAYPRRLFDPRFTPLFYVPFTLACLAGALYRSPWVGVSAVMVQLAPLVAAFGSMVSFVFAFRQLRKARLDHDSISLARGRAIVVGLAALALSALFDIMPVIESSIAWMFYSTLVIVFAFVVAFSMVRHNALDIDRFTASLVGYGGTTLIVAAFFVGLVIGVPSLLGNEFDSPLTTALISGACFLVFQPLHRRLRRRIDRLFMRQERDEGVEVRLLNELSTAVRVRELPQAFKAALETLEILGASRAELWASAPGGAAFARVASSRDDALAPPPIKIDSDLGMALKEMEGSAGVETLAGMGLAVSAQEELWRLGLVIASPIASEERLEGFIGLGRKENGTAFTARDRLFLEAVGTQLAIAMDRNWQRAQRIGNYVLRERLGTGGMAEVLLAEKLGPGGFGRRVAMKRILPHLAQERDAVAMFLDEARFAARLHHPNIVQVYDIEEHEKTYYLSMELLDGPSLKEWIRASAERPGLMPLDAVMALAEALLGALEHVHSRVDDQGEPMGLVHRDVKPANLLCSREGDVKLGDFGIARAEFRLYQTSPGMSRGTPRYMAPEVLAGEDATPAADLFAAGSVLFEAVSLAVAFERGPLESRRPALPGRFESAVERRMNLFFEHALALQPQGRFGSARTMLDAFLATAASTQPASRRRLAEIFTRVMS